MHTTTIEARKAPRTQEMKLCCQVRPTATRLDPVFHPVRLNWLENQYKGKLYLKIVLVH